MMIYLQIKRVIIVVRPAFHEANKYYCQVFLDECLHKLQIYIMIELTFLKELMLRRQANQKTVTVIFSIYLSLNKGHKFQPDVCNGCHDVLMMSINLSDIAILNIHGADYCCIINRISKCEAIKVMQNIDLTEKSRTLQNI